MSDLAIWVGPRPESPEAADAEFERRMDAMEAQLNDGTDQPAAPQLVSFVQAAIARFPEGIDEPGRESPWASEPLMHEIVGDLIYIAMTFSGAEHACDALAELADSLGLVCYDPQAEGLLPDPFAAPSS